MPVLHDETHYYFQGNLTLHPENGIKFTHGVPQGVSGGARILALEIQVPKSVFQTPALRATIDISDEQTDAIQIDTQACAGVLKEVIGADVAVTVRRPDEGDEQ